LENQNAFITGAGRGIGRAIAQRFAEEGANLFICGTNPEILDNAIAELRKLGIKVGSRIADISLQKPVKETAEQALKEYGRIDILVNNAGINIPRQFTEYTAEEFDRVVKVNLYGVFNVTQAILPGMIANRKGKIINIASTAGKWGSKGQSAYNASKHGIIGLTRCIALEVAAFNIHVNAICPSIVEETGVTAAILEQLKAQGLSEEDALKQATARIPMNRFIHRREIANLALYLASDESTGITAQSLAIDGGYTMI